MKRTLFVLIAGLAATATALAIAGVTAASSSGTTLHLKGTRLTSVQPGAKPGAVYVQTEAVSGDKSGRDAVTCVLATKAGQGVCTFVLSLSGGQITSTGLVDLGKPTFEVAVTGGTRDYAGSGGVITVTNTSATRTDYLVKLT